MRSFDADLTLLIEWVKAFSNDIVFNLNFTATEGEIWMLIDKYDSHVCSSTGKFASTFRARFCQEYCASKSAFA